MTSYSRHAPVGGKQGGIQPGCNQYQGFYMLVGFWGSDLFMDSSAVATESRSPVVLGSTRWLKRDAEGDTDTEEEEGDEEWLKKRLQHSSAVTQTSALIRGSAPRWSSESHISSVLRQTYDIDSGGISLTGSSRMLTFQ